MRKDDIFKHGMILCRELFFGVSDKNSIGREFLAAMIVVCGAIGILYLIARISKTQNFDMSLLVFLILQKPAFCMVECTGGFGKPTRG